MAKIELDQKIKQEELRLIRKIGGLRWV